MIADNRYFPWFDQLYTNSDSRYASFDMHGFFLSGRHGYCQQSRAKHEDNIVYFSELLGEVKLAEVGASLAQAGLTNPIPADWRWYADMKVRLPAFLQAQGLEMSGYVPVSKHIGFGASAVMMQLQTSVSMVPDGETREKLYLDAPGNQLLFSQTVQNIYKELGIKRTSFSQVGCGDVVVYLDLYDVSEYEYKCKKLDWGAWFGVIIPCGQPRDIHNLGSLPFGSECGSWGLFIAPRIEMELKDDLRFGIQGRVIQRFNRSIARRIPIGKEQQQFAPIVGSMEVDQEPTLMISPYLVVEDIRGGFGVQARYTLAVHPHDTFFAEIANSNLRPQLGDVDYYSGWVQEYGTIRLFYDMNHDKVSEYSPLVYVSWDIPMNHLAGRCFAKTNKIAIGCNFNF